MTRSDQPSGSDKPSVATGKDQRARDAASARQDYRAEKLAVDANTARLRLARDAAAKDAAAKSAKKSKKRAPRTAK